MTTPTNFQRLPSESSFYNGQMVMGAQASSLALALKQMQGVKYRALANYHVSRTTWQILYWIGPVYTEAQLNTGHGTMEKGNSEDIDLLIGTMPSTEWLAIELVYGPSNQEGYVPQVTIELYTLGTTTPKGTKIDEGIKFQAPYDLVSARQGSGTGAQRTHTAERRSAGYSPNWSAADWVENLTSRNALRDARSCRTVHVSLCVGDDRGVPY